MKNGTHFWAELDNKLVMMCKCKDGYYVCGGWEGSIPENTFIVVQLVVLPKGYSTSDLYYQ